MSWDAEKIAILRTMRDDGRWKDMAVSFGEYCQIYAGISLAKANRLLDGPKSDDKENISAELRWHIWERDDFRCHYCGARQFLSLDHIVPESAGGTLDPENLLTACMPCNRAKGTKSFEEF